MVNSRRNPVAIPLNLLHAMAILAHINGYANTDITIKKSNIIKAIIIKGPITILSSISLLRIPQFQQLFALMQYYLRDILALMELNYWHSHIRLHHLFYN